MKASDFLKVDFNARDGDQYETLLESIRYAFDRAMSLKLPLFTTNAHHLFDKFLEALPVDVRQHYTCNTCRKFVENFGSLVTINQEGKSTPIMWDYIEAPDFFKSAVAYLHDYVGRAKITGMFYTTSQEWGKFKTGYWNHMAVTPPSRAIHTSLSQDTFQRSAEKKEDFSTLIWALQDFPLALVESAHNLLATDSLLNSVKFVGVTQWLIDIHKRRNAANGDSNLMTNIVWNAVATAPAGFCHVRNSVVGSLLVDIKSGFVLDDIKRRFASKVGISYQRPTIIPSAGNIRQAEIIVEQMGIKNSLKRRYAKFEELKTFWLPAQATVASETAGVFDHLKPKGTAANPKMDTNLITMTWSKFEKTVLPNAVKIEVYTPGYKLGYAGILTAVDVDAPPIILWDTIENRNPFTWFFHVGGSFPTYWGLKYNSYVNVLGLCLQPSMWNGGFENKGKGVFFALEGASNLKYSSTTLCLFPQFLKSELHQVRSTIDAYSNNGHPEGEGEPSACGRLIQSNNPVWDIQIRVTTSSNIQNVYKLDRWD